MLERKVQIGGTIYDRHELVMVTLQPGREATVTVRSSRPEAGDGTMTETSYECELTGEPDFSAWEQAVWALPEFGEWVDRGEMLDDVLDILTDEQAETVTDLHHEWAVGITYDEGRRVRYDGVLYRCVQPHTSQADYTPALTPALWVRTSTEDWPEWVQPTGAHDAYAKGDKVTHGGSHWISTYDGKNVWEPGVFGWEEK